MGSDKPAEQEEPASKVQLETDKEEANAEEEATPIITQEVDSSFKEISKGSQEVIENIEKTMNEETKVPSKTDSFDEIEKESKDIVDKLQTTLKTSDPEWNFTANFDINTTENSEIMIEVFDEDIM